LIDYRSFVRSLFVGWPFHKASFTHPRQTRGRASRGFTHPRGRASLTSHESRVIYEGSLGSGPNPTKGRYFTAPSLIFHSLQCMEYDWALISFETPVYFTSTSALIHALLLLINQSSVSHPSTVLRACVNQSNTLCAWTGKRTSKCSSLALHSQLP